MYSVAGVLLLLEFGAQFYTIASSGFTKVASEIGLKGRQVRVQSLNPLPLLMQ